MFHHHIVVIRRQSLLLWRQYTNRHFSNLNKNLNNNNQPLTIGLIPGDGIGLEVIESAKLVLESLPIQPTLKFKHLDAGFQCFLDQGTSLPQQTIDSLRKECSGALFGAVQSPIHKVQGYSSAIVQLRKQMDLFANIRPISNHRAWTAKGKQVPVDLVIVRENTECLYIKKESIETDPATNMQVAYAQRQISEHASKRIGAVALEIHNSRLNSFPDKPFTIVHKSNVLSVTDGLFRTSILSLIDVNKVNVQDQLIDSMVYRIFLEPELFNVMVCPNLYGDILSDAGAALAGSLGMVPSLNLGDSFVIGEPVHGSAPDIAGKGKANPIAAIRSAALLLQWLGYTEQAKLVDLAVHRVLAMGIKTVDLGGTHSTQDVTQAIVRQVETIHAQPE